MGSRLPDFLQPRVQHDFLKIIMDQNVKLMQEVHSLRKEMADLVRKEVDKALGEKVAMIDGSLQEVIVQKKIFIEKGFITRQELNEKYKELKEKSNG
jgi:hypothetical protein